MTDPKGADSSCVPKSPWNNWGWGDVRKILILVVSAAWLMVWTQIYEKDKESFHFLWFVFPSFVFLYLMDSLYSLLTAQRVESNVKHFLFQTAVPIFAIMATVALAMTKCIDSSATITLFGISLGYTTFVVGKEFKASRKEKNDSPPQISSDV